METNNTQYVPVRVKNPGTAAVLSFFIPGLGHMYAGHVGQGLLVFFIAMPLLWVIAFGILASGHAWGLLIPLIGWVWQIFDAKRLAA